MGLTYRPEIDGLRAIAVCAVVLYHAGIGHAGYVGVDIFFVISGYLITAQLLRNERIDLKDFYARRVRRILPASLVVILATVALGHLLLPVPAEANLIRSAAAAAIFVANLFFSSMESDYFGPNTSELPLLHLWSLSVEEQFYLVWPLLLLVTSRHLLVFVLGGLAIASFALAEWLMYFNPSAAFYQTPARFWELAVGGLIATSRERPLPRPAATAGIVGTLIACSVPIGHFPGLGALPAVLSSALLVAAIHGGATNRLLSARPMVAIGLISYSIYLWHWPLLAFYRATTVGPGELQTRLLLCMVSVVLAIGTYRYVESPLRRRRFSSGRTVAFGFGSMALLAVGAWKIIPTVPPSAPTYVSKCYAVNSGERTRMQRPSCFGKGPKVAIWGDSFAHAWTPMAEVLAADAHLPAITFARDACPPLLNSRFVLRSRQEERDCVKWNDEAIRYLQTYGADTLIITARWQAFITPEIDGSAALFRAVSAVAPFVRQVLVIAPTPYLPDDPGKCISLGSDCAVSRSEYEAQSAEAWLGVKSLQSIPNVTLLDPTEWLCDENQCLGVRNGVALYSDWTHVTQDTARDIANRWLARSTSAKVRDGSKAGDHLQIVRAE